MRTTSRLLFVAVTATVGFAATHVEAQTYVEPASGGFGTATLPPDAQEFFRSTFGAMPFYWDQYGRVIANADVTATAGPGPLTQINPRLWSGSDADLFKFEITDPATFSAQITSATNILALFGPDGTAIAASRGGGAANALTGTSLLPGTYYIGESQASGTFGGATYGVPRNDANLPLFDFTTDGVKTPISQADMRLSINPEIAWTIHGNANPAGGFFLIGPSTFTSPGPNIVLTGAAASVVPEPATLAIPALFAAAALRRRRAR